MVLSVPFRATRYSPLHRRRRSEPETRASSYLLPWSRYYPKQFLPRATKHCPAHCRARRSSFRPNPKGVFRSAPTARCCANARLDYAHLERVATEGVPLMGKMSTAGQKRPTLSAWRHPDPLHPPLSALNCTVDAGCVTEYCPLLQRDLHGWRRHFSDAAGWCGSNRCEWSLE